MTNYIDFDGFSFGECDSLIDTNNTIYLYKIFGISDKLNIISGITVAYCKVAKNGDAYICSVFRNADIYKYCQYYNMEVSGYYIKSTAENVFNIPEDYCSYKISIDGNYTYVSDEKLSKYIDDISKDEFCIKFDESIVEKGLKEAGNDIDKLKDYPDTDVVTISGLHQDTFEYFIKTYGTQFKVIRFFKNKLVEDWSLLGTLSNLEYIHFFANQRISSLWDMSRNTALSGLCIEDFTKLDSMEGIGTAPALREFRIGNAVWSTMILKSLLPLANTNIEKFMFCGKSITENDYSFLSDMPNLKQFDFPTNMLTTEQVAWIVANFPNLEGYALKAKVDFAATSNHAAEVLIVGKRKPMLTVENNEKRIEKYIQNFETLKKNYVGVPYKMAFPD